MTKKKITPPSKARVWVLMTLISMGFATSALAASPLREETRRPGESQKYSRTLYTVFDFDECPEVEGLVECWADVSIIENRRSNPVDRVLDTETRYSQDARPVYAPQPRGCKNYYTQVDLWGRFAYWVKSGLKVKLSKVEFEHVKDQIKFKTERIDKWSTIEDSRRLCRNKNKLTADKPDRVS